MELHPGQILLSPEDVAQLAALPPPPAPPSPIPAPVPVPQPDPLPPGDVVRPIGEKPTDASTGPRSALTDVMVSLTTPLKVSGAQKGKHFRGGQVKAQPGSTWADCAVDNFQVGNGPVRADYCDLGYLIEQTNNLDPLDEVLHATHCKVSGPEHNDAVRFGPYVWGDQTRLIDVLLEDCLIQSPFTDSPGAHFDLIQTGGGKGYVKLNRCALRYLTTAVQEDATAYFNNGAHNVGVELTDVWVDGGPVAYVFQGPMKVTRAAVARSCKRFGYVYPSALQSMLPVLTDVYDDAGAPILAPKGA